MSIEIKESEKLQFEYKGKKFEVCSPKVAFLREFNTRLKNSKKEEAEENAVDIIYDFCIKAGVPVDVLDDWGMAQMEQFMSDISSVGEKKT